MSWLRNSNKTFVDCSRDEPSALSHLRRRRSATNNPINANMVRDGSGTAAIGAPGTALPIHCKEGVSNHDGQKPSFPNSEQINSHSQNIASNVLTTAEQHAIPRQNGDHPGGWTRDFLTRTISTHPSASSASSRSVSRRLRFCRDALMKGISPSGQHQPAVPSQRSPDPTGRAGSANSAQAASSSDEL